MSSNVDVDMNDELIAHGYSNMLSGLFGGLQNVMTYSFSVLFQKSGGSGVSSCLAVAAGIAGLFVYGPAIAVYFPRCMAGTLLLHIGLDLFLEGSYDSYGNFDTLEYAGIWFVMIVMTIYGMTAGLFAGVLAALSTHAAQSIKNINPIFRILHATTLRSSSWERPSGAMDILDSATAGRARILIFQLQGHLFFGNVAVRAMMIQISRCFFWLLLYCSFYSQSHLQFVPDVNRSLRTLSKIRFRARAGQMNIHSLSYWISP